MSASGNGDRTHASGPSPARGERRTAPVSIDTDANGSRNDTENGTSSGARMAAEGGRVFSWVFS